MANYRFRNTRILNSVLDAQKASDFKSKPLAIRGDLTCRFQRQPTGNLSSQRFDWSSLRFQIGQSHCELKIAAIDASRVPILGSDGSSKKNVSSRSVICIFSLFRQRRVPFRFLKNCPGSAGFCFGSQRFWLHVPVLFLPCSVISNVQLNGPFASPCFWLDMVNDMLGASSVSSKFQTVVVDS